MNVRRAIDELAESDGYDYVDDVPDPPTDAPPPRRTYARGERKVGGASVPLTPRAMQVLRAICNHLIGHRAGPRLADINRAICEPADHQGVWTTLRSLLARRMIAYAGKDTTTMRATRAGAEAIGIEWGERIDVPTPVTITVEPGAPAAKAFGPTVIIGTVPPVPRIETPINYPQINDYPPDSLTAEWEAFEEFLLATEAALHGPISEIQDGVRAAAMRLVTKIISARR
jgi:hypothetical protein